MSFYEFLGVSSTAKLAEIKKAYKKLSIKYHPDKNINNPDIETIKEKFQRLNFIYSTLSNEEKRAYYDKHGESNIEDFDGEEGEEAEEVDEENGEEIKSEDTPELLSKLGKTQISQEKMEEILDEVNEEKYAKNKVNVWTEEIVKEEFQKANEANVLSLDWSNKQIRLFPKKFNYSELTNLSSRLRRLNLNRNQLKDLPSEFALLKSIREIHLSDNLFTSIPVDLFLNWKDTLQVISMERNKVKEIPEKLNQLTQLRSIYLFGNQISKVDKNAFDGLAHLQKVDLQLNFIKSLPSALLKMKETKSDFELLVDEPFVFADDGEEDLEEKPKNTRKRTKKAESRPQPKNVKKRKLKKK